MSQVFSLSIQISAIFSALAAFEAVISYGKFKKLREIGKFVAEKQDKA